MKARARATDPATSHEAAKLIEGDGKAARERRILLDLVRRFPHQTAPEYGQMSNIERHEVSRRLPELRKAGYIDNNPKSRICRVTHSHAMTWCPAVDPPAPEPDLFPNMRRQQDEDLRRE